MDHTPTFSQKVAGGLAHSFLLRKGKELHEKHINDWQLGGSFISKLQANVYLILHDYSTGEFPTKLKSREETFEQEREQFHEMEGSTTDEMVESSMRKPYGFPMRNYYFRCLDYTIELLQTRNIKPGSHLMELGCGAGWLAEMLALEGYRVTGTTIAPIDVEAANRRIEALRIKGLPAPLKFICAPMEELRKHVGDEKYDAIYCFEALHHVYDWRESLTEATRFLRPGGALMILSEPPTLHTYVCHRSAKIFKTHEIGFKAGDIIKHLKSLGYTSIDYSRPVFIEKVRDFWKLFSPFTIKNGSVISRAIWIVATKPN